VLDIFFPILNQTQGSSQIFLEAPNNKFRWNPSSGGRADTRRKREKGMDWDI